MGVEWQRLLAEPLVIRAILVLLGLLTIFLAVRLIQRSVTQRVEVPHARYRIRKIIALGGYLLIVLFISLVFSDQLGHLAVAFGVIGAGVAFALQEIIASMGGWVAITLGRYYQVGDRILINGILGDVIDINSLRTTLMECGGWVGADLYNGRIVRIPNSSALGDPIYNYSADFPYLWDEITLPIKYGGDAREARTMLERVADELLDEHIQSTKKAWQSARRVFLLDDERVEPTVTLQANDNWIEFTLRYVVDYRQRRQMKDRLYTRILEEVDQLGARVEIASTTIQLVDPAPFSVRLDKSKEDAQR